MDFGLHNCQFSTYICQIFQNYFMLLLTYSTETIQITLKTTTITEQYLGKLELI